MQLGTERVEAYLLAVVYEGVAGRRHFRMQVLSHDGSTERGAAQKNNAEDRDDPRIGPSGVFVAQHDW